MSDDEVEVLGGGSAPPSPAAAAAAGAGGADTDAGAADADAAAGAGGDDGQWWNKRLDELPDDDTLNVERTFPFADPPKDLTAELLPFQRACCRAAGLWGVLREGSLLVGARGRVFARGPLSGLPPGSAGLWGTPPPLSLVRPLRFTTTTTTLFPPTPQASRCTG